MSDFTKTVMVDPDGPYIQYLRYLSIQDAVNDTYIQSRGGTIIVEQGTYTIGSGQTPMIPSNTTLIGRGNAVIKIDNGDESAFRAANHANTNSNSRIVISGFKIIVKVDNYANHAIWLQNTSDCIVEKVYVTSLDGETYYPIDNNSNAILLRATVDNKCINNTVRQCSVVNYGRFYSGVYDYGSGITVFSYTPSEQPQTKYCKRNSIINNYTDHTLHGCILNGALETSVLGNVFINAQNLTNGDRAAGILAGYCDGS